MSSEAEDSAHSLTLPAGLRHIGFTDLDSTNEEARRRAEAGDPGGLWITAERQSAGRGRRGRDWVSPSGNLMATLLLRPDHPAGEAAQLSFAAALAVHDTVSGFLPDPKGAGLAIKWPNDVRAGRRKLAGILLESSAGPEGRLAWLAVGIGVNLAHFPDDLPYPATSLRDLGGTATPLDFLPALAASFQTYQQAWEREGFAPLRTAWLARAEGRGGEVTVRLGSGSFEGRFEDLTEDGELAVRLSDGSLRLVGAGEVFIAGAAR